MLSYVLIVLLNGYIGQERGRCHVFVTDLASEAVVNVRYGDYVRGLVPAPLGAGSRNWQDRPKAEHLWTDEEWPINAS